MGLCIAVLRGGIVNRTYSTHKNLPGTYFPIFTNNIWSYLLWSPVIVQTVYQNRALELLKREASENIGATPTPFLTLFLLVFFVLRRNIVARVHSPMAVRSYTMLWRPSSLTPRPC